VTLAPPGPEYARIRLALGASKFFAGLPPASLDRLAAVARLRRHGAGGPIHRPGQAASKLWLVLEGGLRVAWPSGQQPVTIAVMGEGSFYGIGAFVEGASVETMAIAERGTVTAVIDAEDLQRARKADSDIAALIPRLVLVRFEALLSLYADAVSAPLPQRLARRLVSQALASSELPARADFELRTSQTHLAQMLGASRSKVNTELRKLEREDVVRLGYRKIFIHDLTKLCQAAGQRVIAL
jgi:CRP/FNR family cyclic AMP-dependent transcriptional regulator